MKVLLVRPGPSFSVQDVAFGWRDGLRSLGVEVGDYNHDDRLDFYWSARIEHDGEMRQAFNREAAIEMACKSVLATCYEFWPDIVLIVSGFFLPTKTVDVIKAHGHLVVAVLTESPYEDDRQIEYARHVDIALINDPANIEAFRSVQPNTFYVPHAYNPERHHPGPAVPALKCDAAFVGTGFPSRQWFLEQIDWTGLDFVLGGSWGGLPDEHPLVKFLGHRKDWCMDNAETADLYRSCKASFNLYRREHNDTCSAEGWAVGPREIELAACGTFFLRDPRPEGDLLFPGLPTFTEPGEVRELLDWWLAHDVERELAAARARDAIVDHTFGHNARWLLQQTERF